MAGVLLQEVAEHIVAVFGKQGFGMELYAFDGVVFVAHAHDFLVFCPRGDFKTVGQAGAFDDEAVVAGAGYGIGQAYEDALVVVKNGGGFAVHQGLGADDVAAEGFANALVAKAYAEYGQFARKVLHGGNGNTRFFGRTGAWPDDKVFGVKAGDFVETDFVIAAHLDVLAKFGKVLDDVVGETVVVVDEKEHGGFSFFGVSGVVAGGCANRQCA